jgi:hypothetical protein
MIKSYMMAGDRSNSDRDSKPAIGFYYKSNAATPVALAIAKTAY